MKVFGIEVGLQPSGHLPVLRDVLRAVVAIPRLSLKQSESIIKMYLEGKITDNQLHNYVYSHESYSGAPKEKVFRRLDLWQEHFGPFSDDDLAFLHSNAASAGYGGKPTDIHGIASYIRRRVIGQDEAIKKIVSAVWLHCESVRKGLGIKVPAHLLIGQTGVGKTHILNLLSELLLCPVIGINASSTVAPGYRGGDSIIDQVFNQLAAIKDQFPNLQEMPIVIMINEIDKAVRGQNEAYRVELMSSIMCLIEKNKIFKAGFPGDVPQSLDLKNCLLLFDGCFDKIEDVVARRLNLRRIGFNGSCSTKEATEIGKQVTGADLVQFGMMPEFVGRIGGILCLNKMTVDTLYQILDRSVDSPVKKYVKAFEKYGLHLEFTDDALRAIARVAFTQNLGARTLENIVCSVMQPYTEMFDSDGGKHITITEADVASSLNLNI